MKQAWLCLLAVLFTLAMGCSTPETRSRENPGAFEKLSARQKSTVLQGKVERGMSADAVIIAFGKPTRVEKAGATEHWIYTRAEFYEVPHWRERSVPRADGRMATIPEYDPLQMKRSVDDLEVIFKNRKVASWKKIGR